MGTLKSKVLCSQSVAALLVMIIIVSLLTYSRIRDNNHTVKVREPLQRPITGPLVSRRLRLVDF